MLYPKSQSKINYQKFEVSQYLPHSHSGFGTMAIHAGQAPQQIHGSVNVPIYYSCIFVKKNFDLQTYHQSAQENPTLKALEDCYSALQYGKYGLVFSSGCGGTSSIIHILSKGDHVLICDIVYGGTQGYMKKFASQAWNLDIEFIDMLDLDLVRKALKPTTKLVWMETPTNPHLKIIDIQLILKTVKTYNSQIITVVDNTFCTPYLQSPLLLGVDISYSSLTKYVGGHSDLVMGAIATNNREIYQKVHLARQLVGTLPSPFESYLAIRGAKTLQIRVVDATKNAYHLANFLQNHPLISQVLYPGLKSHPQYDIGKKQMRGYGAMISFQIKESTLERVSKFLRSLKVAKLAESLGGAESVMKVPAFMNDKIFLNQLKKQKKPENSLIRFSVGVESLEDLIFDIDQALKACFQMNQRGAE